jgi:hypothetical protein
MLMNNIDPISQLIVEMKHDAEDWESEEEVALEEKYGERVQEVGACRFLECLFRNYFDSTLLALMSHFFFVWKDLHYQDWASVLYRIAEDRSALYGFIIFCGQFLGVDIGRVIQEDEHVHEKARQFLAMYFAHGTPGPGSQWLVELFREHGMEPSTLWKRLKSEGAPMKVDI